MNGSPAAHAPGRGMGGSCGAVLLTVGVVVFLAGLHNLVTISLVARCLRHGEGAPGGPAGFAGAAAGALSTMALGGARPPAVSRQTPSPGAKRQLPPPGPRALAAPGAARRAADAASVAAAKARAAVAAARAAAAASVGGAGGGDAPVVGDDGGGDQEPLGFAEAAERVRQLLRPEQLSLLRGVSERASADGRAAAIALARAIAASVLAGATGVAEPTVIGDAAAAAGAFDDAGFYTRQTCYLQTDESELCVFDHALCFDGTDAVVSIDMSPDDVRARAAAVAAAEHREAAPDVAAATAAAAADESRGVPPLPSVPSLRFASVLGACQDARYGEPASLESSGCQWSPGPSRVPGAGSGSGGVPPAPATDFPLPLFARQWGPSNAGREFTFRGLPPSSLWPSPADGDGFGSTEAVAAAQRLGAPPLRPPPHAAAGARRAGGGAGRLQGDAAQKAAAAAAAQLIPGLSVSRRTFVDGRVVDWMDGALWIVALEGQAAGSPLAWWERVGVLYDARRHNASGWVPSAAAAADASGGDGFAAVPHVPFGSHPRDGYIRWLKRWQIASAQAIVMPPASGPPSSFNTARFRTGAQWPLPPIDAVAFAGQGGRDVASAARLSSWAAGELRLAAGPGAAAGFRDLAKVLSPRHLLCAPRGAVVGWKPKLFTGRADGWLHRQYAYATSGLAARGARSHPRYVPRHVTLLDLAAADGRRVWNIKQVAAAIEETGIPFKVLTVPFPASTPYVDIVRAMSDTGILVGATDASLFAAAYLPAHSVLIEMLPAGTRRTTFRYLAEAKDVHYYPVLSSQRPPCGLLQDDYGVQSMHTDEYYDQCTALNASSYDAALSHTCFTPHTLTPMAVPIPQFRAALYDAIDTISAFSLRNPVWDALANKTGATANIPPFREIQWNVFRKY